MAEKVLTDEDAKAIYERAWGQDTNLVIAVDFMVTPQTVSDIKTGRTWGHVTGQRMLRTPKRQLSVADVLEIDHALRQGRRVKDIAADYAVVDQTIRNIQSGRNWSHITGRPYNRRK